MRTSLLPAILLVALWPAATSSSRYSAATHGKCEPISIPVGLSHWLLIIIPRVSILPRNRSIIRMYHWLFTQRRCAPTSPTTRPSSRISWGNWRRTLRGSTCPNTCRSSRDATGSNCLGAKYILWTFLHSLKEIWNTGSLNQCAHWTIGEMLSAHPLLPLRHVRPCLHHPRPRYPALQVGDTRRKCTARHFI